jgi:hypothetical protein
MFAAEAAAGGKTLYQRIFYQFTPGSDVERHAGLVLEERVRFRTGDGGDDEEGKNPVPYGHRTLLLRDGNVQDGEIGDTWFQMDVHNHHSRNKLHHDGSIGGKALEAQIVTALYLAHCPSLVEHGKILQVACDDGLAGLLGCIGAGILLRRAGNYGSVAVAGSDADAPSLSFRNETEAGILTVPHHRQLLPPDLELLLLTDADESNVERVCDHVQNAGVEDKKIVAASLDWKDRTPYRPGLMQREYFRAIVASDVAMTYPEAKELARTVANRLEPSYPYASSYDPAGTEPLPYPRFVHVCPEDRPDVSYLNRLLEKGYRMTVSTGYLKLDKLVFKYQTMPSSTPESDLEDMELELAHESQVTYQSLTASHHVEYAGDGSGEWFFPMETGEYDGSTSGSSGTYLEREANKGPW